MSPFARSFAWVGRLGRVCGALCVFLFLFSAKLGAQHTVEPRLVFDDTARYAFTSEWQYLSTDIFLFHAEGFEEVINELDFYNPYSKRKRRRRGNREELEALFITAALRNVRFFGDQEVTYPLYNFRIAGEGDGKSQSFLSDRIDHVRVLDNLPLYSARDHIDADIKVHAITSSNRDMVLSLVARQLKNISNLLTPAGAVMSLIGEFGNLLEANTRQKEYRFSTTIRLFEQKNFDMRVHSLKVYSLETAASTRDSVDAGRYRAFLDTVGLGVVPRGVLSGVVGSMKYPLIVVVNYKSLYRMEPVSGDEVTFANIEKRKLKVENDHRQGLISLETYRQERDFTGFLTVFATFKSHLDVYKLNYRTGNTDAIGGSLFSLAQYYRALLKAFEELRHKYKGNSTFETIFRAQYEAILGYAMLYLDDDHNLQSTKQLVSTLVDLEHGYLPKNSEESEKAIAALRFSELFKRDMMERQPEGELIRTQLGRLEESLYRTEFLAAIEALRSTPASIANREAPRPLLLLLKNTACGLCRDRSIEAINDFGHRMEKVYLECALAQRDSLVQVLEPTLYRQIGELQSIRERFDRFVASDSTRGNVLFLARKVEDTEQQLARLRDYVDWDPSDRSLSEVKVLLERLSTAPGRLAESIESVCRIEPLLCGRGVQEALPGKPLQPSGAQDSVLIDRPVSDTTTVKRPSDEPLPSRDGLDNVDGI